jgi:hypothetical protein
MHGRIPGDATRWDQHFGLSGLQYVYAWALSLSVHVTAKYSVQSIHFLTCRINASTNGCGERIRIEFEFE